MNKSKPLVSILIPCYNHGKFVTETLDSILDDDYPNKEIIIIDDGSTDDSNQKILKWITTHAALVSIKYKTQENQGVCCTLNSLVSLSSGKYLLPIASDDLLINNTISGRVDLLESHPEKLILLSDASIIGSNREVLFESSIQYHNAQKECFKSDEGILNQTLTNLAISGATVLIRKETYETIGPYPIDLTTEDWYFYQRLACLNKILFYDHIVSLYRLHDSNTSNIYNYVIFRDISRTFVRNFAYFPHWRNKIFGIKQIIKFYLISLKVRYKYQTR